MENTIRIHYTLQSKVPSVPGSTNLRTTQDDGPDHKLVTAGNEEDFAYWRDHLDANRVPYEVAD